MLGSPKKKSVCWKVGDFRRSRDATRRTAPGVRAVQSIEAVARE